MLRPTTVEAGTVAPPLGVPRSAFVAGPHSDTGGMPPGPGPGGPQPPGDPSGRRLAGPGVHGAPGVSGATNGGAHGGIEHAPRYFTGETIFDLPPCALPVIGESDRVWR
jgi:hypothetical protein